MVSYNLLNHISPTFMCSVLTNLNGDNGGYQAELNLLQMVDSSCFFGYLSFRLLSIAKLCGYIS